jgi:hypothetical protein
MAEVKNSFLKSKMNKDLDSRLLPNGEYRDAVNVQVIKSESEDVGALENVQGNINVGDFSILVGEALSCVGHFVDQTNSKVYLFFTTNQLNSGTKYNPEAKNYIFRWSDKDGIELLVEGAFLNFHPKFPIIGVNLLEQLLFFTDNRNQPRKINVDQELGYYTTEDQISVAKYNPYLAINVYNKSSQQVTITTPVQVTQKAENTINVHVNSTTDVLPGFCLSSPQYIKNELDQIVVADVNSTENIITFNRQVTLDVGNQLNFFYTQTSMFDAVSETLPDGSTNPFYEFNFRGDPNFLEDKFAKFSYRFRFDDGEYSILAPFTQACFIPKQDGYFLEGDEKQTFSSTIVDFAKNKVNKITLQIPLPDRADNIKNSYKISELDIIYKESDALAVQVVETFSVKDIAAASKGSSYFSFDYVSTKPYKTLPESELVRVYDKTPVKAFSQEVSSNRIIYGNFQDKHTPPTGINYQVSATRKLEANDVGSSLGTVEYPSSNVKENRNYQVGVVLSDKFGRQSTVILSNNESTATTEGFKADTVYLPYSKEDSNDSEFMWNFLGNSLKVQFNNTFGGESTPRQDGEPGLYNGNVADVSYNPLGWYSYKIVVKQVEQDYYNVYSAGAMKDLPFNYITSLPPTGASPVEENTSFITLLNDNINKIPRDLSEVGPQDKTFRSSVKLYGRVMNTANEFVVDGNEQFSEANDGSPGRSEFTTNNIEDLFDLFDVSQFEDVVDRTIFITNPVSPFYSFYKADSNPFVAEFITSQSSDFQFGINNQKNTIPVGTADVQSQVTSGSNIDLNNNQAGLEIKPGQLVTGTNISADSYVVLYDAANNVVTLNKSQGTIASGTTLTFSDVSYLKIENLAVLETAPTVSRLDIFWETTSSGLIEDLNVAIDQGISGPAGIRNFDFFCPESVEPGDSLIKGDDFYFIDENGDKLAVGNVDLTVFDGNGKELTGQDLKIELTQQGGTSFDLIVKDESYFYFEPSTNDDINPLNQFQFSFTVETIGPVFTTIVPVETDEFPFQVTNVEPYLQFSTEEAKIARNYKATTLLRLYQNFNGSADPDRNREGLTYQISNIRGPSAQGYNTEFRITPVAGASKEPENSRAEVLQASKQINRGKSGDRVELASDAQPNFGTYMYDITVTDTNGTGLSRTYKDIVQNICVPSLVDHMCNISRSNSTAVGLPITSVNSSLIQGDGSVEFFVEDLDNLDSYNVIPESNQVGYTTANLNNETNVTVEGEVCPEEDSENDAVYYARAFKSKPVENPSSMFYVLCQLNQSMGGGEVGGGEIITEAGIYAAIEYRENENQNWSIAKDVNDNDCVYGNLYQNDVDSGTNVRLKGMIAENQSGGLANQLKMINTSESTSIGKIQGSSNPEETFTYAAMLPGPGGRVFVLNQPGEYRVAFGNLYNNYNAFTSSGAKCFQSPNPESSFNYEIGDFTNASYGSILKGMANTNVYQYQTSIIGVSNNEPTCDLGMFAPGLTLYSASPAARYLFTPNKTQVESSEISNVQISESDEIFGLFADRELLIPFQKTKEYQDIVNRLTTNSMKGFARIRRVDRYNEASGININNPEQTRDGSYLLVIAPQIYRQYDHGMIINGPCLDSLNAVSNGSGDITNKDIKI